MRKLGRSGYAVMAGFIAAAVIGLVAMDPADAAEKLSKDRLIVSGGTIGGTSNLSGNAMASVIFKYCKIPTTITANSTFAQVSVIQKKEADIATAVGYQAYDAYKGLWKGAPYPDVRILLQSNMQVYHFITMKKSPIQNFMDLKGKRVVVGKKGFFAEDVTKRIHNALGLEYGKFFTPLFLGHSDAAASLVNGTIDAYVVMSNFPQPQVTEIAESHDCNVLGLGREIMDKVVGKDPNLTKITIPAKSYKGMDKSADTVTAWMLYAADKSLPDDIAYCATKSFFDNLDYASVHYAELKNYKLKDIEGFTSAPYHKGALRYFKEKGLKIPDVMIPPEAK